MAPSKKEVDVSKFYHKLYRKEKAEPWVPTDQQLDYDRYKALTRKMGKFIIKLESSQFYHDFHEEVQRFPIVQHIQRVLGLASKMSMVIYGIGSIESNVNSRWQLSLAILMKKDFNWIGDVTAFDPILSTTEIRILESFGCSVMNTNKNGSRQVLKPTVFFMPYCDINLFNNLLESNWKPNQLSNIIIFGNSLDFYIKYILKVQGLLKVFINPSNDPITERKRKLYIWRIMGNILAAQTFTDEFKMRTISYDHHARLPRENCEYSFHSLSWHFFSPLTETFMQLMSEYTRKKYDVSPEKKEHLVISNPSPKE